MKRSFLLEFIVFFSLLLSDLGAALAGGAFPPVPPPSKRQAKKIAVESKDGVTRLGSATYQFVKGIHVLHVKGTPYEMAFQHGVLLRKQIQEGVVPFLPRVFRRILDENDFLKAELPPLIKLSTVANWFVIKPIEKNIPDLYKQEIKGLADGADLDDSVVASAYAIPDAFLVVIQMLHHYNLLSEVPLWGCSSFAAWGGSTKNGGGSLIHGRNLDYTGIGIWDRNPTLIYFEPADGHGFKYVAATSAGAHSGGITAINEHGLALGLHSILSTDVNTDGGVPILMIGDQIMRRAKNIEEAVAVAREFKRIGSWSFFVSHYKGKSVKSGVIEVTASSVKLAAHKNDHLNSTNFFFTPALREKELNINRSIVEGYEQRFKRMNQLVQKFKGKHSVDAAIAILSDHVDPITLKGEVERGASPNIISSPDNIQSVIFQGTEKGSSPLDEIEIWISAGTVPASHGPYVRFSMREGFEDKNLTANGSVVKTIPVREGSGWTKGMRHYVKAYELLSQEGNNAVALEELKKALEADPKDGGYHLMTGLLALKLGNQELAREHLEKAANPGENIVITSHQRNLALFFRGILHEVSGEKERGITLYKQILNFDKADAKLKRVINQRLAELDSPVDTTLIIPDLKYMDSLAYAMTKKNVAELRASIPGISKHFKELNQ